MFKLKSKTFYKKRLHNIYNIYLFPRHFAYIITNDVVKHFDYYVEIFYSFRKKNTQVFIFNREAYTSKTFHENLILVYFKSI